MEKLNKHLKRLESGELNKRNADERKGVISEALFDFVVIDYYVQGETWKEETKLTASDAALGDFFGSSVDISRDTLLVGAPFKDGNRGATYVFVFSGDGS